MFRFDADLQVYLHREPIDFRAGLNTLVTVVEQSMQLDPLAPTMWSVTAGRSSRRKSFCLPCGSGLPRVDFFYIRKRRA